MSASQILSLFGLILEFFSSAYYLAKQVLRTKEEIIEEMGLSFQQKRLKERKFNLKLLTIFTFGVFFQIVAIFLE